MLLSAWRNSWFSMVSLQTFVYGKSFLQASTEPATSHSNLRFLESEGPCFIISSKTVCWSFEIWLMVFAEKFVSNTDSGLTSLTSAACLPNSKRFWCQFFIIRFYQILNFFYLEIVNRSLRKMGIRIVRIARDYYTLHHVLMTRHRNNNRIRIEERFQPSGVSNSIIFRFSWKKLINSIESII